MMKAIKWAKRILPVLLAVTVSCAAFGGCASESPLPDVGEEPPYVQPEEDSDPVVPPETEPDREEPKDDGGDPDSDPVVPPVTEPDGQEPEEEEQRKELTKEQEDQLIVNKILEATLEKVRLAVGNGSKINKVLAIDCKTEENKNYIYLLVDDTNNLVGDCYDLVRISTELAPERANFLSSDVIPTGKFAKNVFRIDKNQIDDSERTKKIYNKLRTDGVLEQTSTPLAMAISEMIGGVDELLQSSYSCLWLYTFSQDELEYTYCAVKDDSGTKDYITDFLLNGTLNKHYREVTDFYYKFSENAIKDFDNGLTVREI